MRHFVILIILWAMEGIIWPPSASRANTYNLSSLLLGQILNFLLFLRITISWKLYFFQVVQNVQFDFFHVLFRFHWNVPFSVPLQCFCCETKHSNFNSGPGCVFDVQNLLGVEREAYSELNCKIVILLIFYSTTHPPTYCCHFQMDGAIIFSDSSLNLQDMKSGQREN